MGRARYDNGMVFFGRMVPYFETIKTYAKQLFVYLQSCGRDLVKCRGSRGRSAFSPFAHFRCNLSLFGTNLDHGGAGMTRRGDGFCRTGSGRCREYTVWLNSWGAGTADARGQAV